MLLKKINIKKCIHIYLYIYNKYLYINNKGCKN